MAEIKKKLRNIWNDVSIKISILLYSFFDMFDSFYCRIFPFYKEPRNINEYRIFSLKRSGVHAFITWMSHQLPCSLILLNNVVHFKDPYIYSCRKRIITSGVERNAKFSEIRRYKNKPALAYSYEDLDLSLLKNNPLVENKKDKVGQSRKQYNIIVLRDPFNLIASRLYKRDSMFTIKTCQRPNSIARNKIFVMEVSERTIAFWKVYAREFLGLTDYLDNKVLVNYNRWFADKEYRKSVSLKLDLEFSDSALNIVARLGSENSFDGRKYNGRAQDMKVLRRWEKYRDNPEFISLFDEETFLLAEKIFKDTLDLERIKKIIGSKINV